MPAEMTRVAPADAARTFSINVYREAYGRGLNVSEYLEQQDPTEELPPEDRALDAFERIGRELQIRSRPVRGVRASSWEEATNTPERRAYMVEWAARVWRQATEWSRPPAANPALANAGTRALMFSQDYVLNTALNQYVTDMTLREKRLVPPIPLDALVARVNNIERDAFRSLYVVDDLNTDAYRFKRITEGTEIPSTTMITGEHYLRIHKYGRALRATYEQLRHQTLDRIAFIIGRMALQAEVDKVADATNVLISGDGNANTAAALITQTSLDPGSTAGTLTLKAWLASKMAFTIAYQPNTVLLPQATALQLLMLPFNTVNGIPLLTNPASQVGGLAPISDYFAWSMRYGVSPDVPSLKMLMFDNTIALEQFNEIGGQISETERYITNQTQILTMTEVTGFGVLDPNASRTFNVNS